MKFVEVLPVLFAATSWTKWIRSLGGVGLLVLGVLDGSIVPTFGSLDLFTGILSVRQRPLWLYYAVMSTIGGVIGAFTTYRLGKKAGTGWLEKKFGEQRSLRVRSLDSKMGIRRSSGAHVGASAVSSVCILFCCGKPELSSAKVHFGNSTG